MTETAALSAGYSEQLAQPPPLVHDAAMRSPSLHNLWNRPEALLLGLLLLACGCGRHAVVAEAPVPAAIQVAVAEFGVTTAEEAQGLSALVAAPDGALWTIPERQDHLLRVRVQAGQLLTERVPLQGKPADMDGESLAMLGDGKFAIGTECHGGKRATDLVLLGHLTANAALVDEQLVLPYSLWQIEAEDNRGLEGLCFAGALFAAAETVLEGQGKRWAPLARRNQDGTWSATKLQLTSRTGRLSALACRPLADGQVELWAIERHYGVSRWLRAVAPVAGPLPAELTTVVQADLARAVTAVLKEVPNFEGIAFDTGDRGAAWLMADNSQGGHIVGPAVLIKLAPAGAKP